MVAELTLEGEQPAFGGVEPEGLVAPPGKQHLKSVGPGHNPVIIASYK